MSDELPEFKKVVLPGDEEPETAAESDSDNESAIVADDGAGDSSDDPSLEDNDDPYEETMDDPDGEAAELDSQTVLPAVDATQRTVDVAEKTTADDADDADDAEDAEDEGDDDEARMGVLEHLQELRKCLTRVVIAVFIGFLPCYAVAAKLFSILMQPMNDAMAEVSGVNAIKLTPEFFNALKESLVTLMTQKGPEFAEQTAYFVAALETALQKVVVNQGQFIYTYPPEAFFAEVKIAFVAGFFLVSPYLFYQIWRFVAPGLYAHERRWIWPVALISAIFFVSGACFGYFVVFPVGFKFFAQFSSDAISFMPKLSEYLDFALKLLIAFGLSFELPVFIFFLSIMGIVTGTGLVKKGKYFILIAFIVGAILTPPDPVSQALMAGPLILLYAMGVIIAFIFGKKPKKKNLWMRP